IRMARVKSAEPVEGTDKLMHLQLDVGGETRSDISPSSLPSTPIFLQRRFFFTNSLHILIHTKKRQRLTKIERNN
ncbi:MAG: hypothetical protein F6K10_43910, partial [Moorea sp. SIO2B7]|nr:hypothetical protein [Moorena sp. SIO2B7]